MKPKPKPNKEVCIIITEESLDFHDEWTRRWKPIFELIWQEFGEEYNETKDRAEMMLAISDAELIICNKLWELKAKGGRRE